MPGGGSSPPRREDRTTRGSTAREAIFEGALGGITACVAVLAVWDALPLADPGVTARWFVVTGLTLTGAAVGLWTLRR